MAIPPRTASTGTFFLTSITYNRRRLFQLPTNAELFLETPNTIAAKASTNSTPSSSCPTTSTSCSPRKPTPSRTS